MRDLHEVEKYHPGTVTEDVKREMLTHKRRSSGEATHKIYENLPMMARVRAQEKIMKLGLIEFHSLIKKTEEAAREWKAEDAAKAESAGPPTQGKKAKGVEPQTPRDESPDVWVDDEDLPGQYGLRKDPLKHTTLKGSLSDLKKESKQARKGRPVGRLNWKRRNTSGYKK